MIYCFQVVQEFQFGRTTFEDSDHCGHLVTVATKNNVAKVKYLIKEDPQITENKIKDSFKLSSGSFNWILFHHVGVWKHCTFWLLHQPTREHWRGRVEWCHHMPQKFDRGMSEQGWDITGNKSSLYQCDPETKQLSLF